MWICENCGYANDETLVFCKLCRHSAPLGMVQQGRKRAASSLQLLTLIMLTFACGLPFLIFLPMYFQSQKEVALFRAARAGYGSALASGEYRLVPVHADFGIVFYQKGSSPYVNLTFSDQTQIRAHPAETSLLYDPWPCRKFLRTEALVELWKGYPASVIVNAETFRTDRNPEYEAPYVATPTAITGVLAAVYGMAALVWGFRRRNARLKISAETDIAMRASED